MAPSPGRYARRPRRWETSTRAIVSSPKGSVPRSLDSDAAETETCMLLTASAGRLRMPCRVGWHFRSPPASRRAGRRFGECPDRVPRAAGTGTCPSATLQLTRLGLAAGGTITCARPTDSPRPRRRDRRRVDYRPWHSRPAASAGTAVRTLSTRARLEASSSTRREPAARARAGQPIRRTASVQRVRWLLDLPRSQQYGGVLSSAPPHSPSRPRGRRRSEVLVSRERTARRAPPIVSTARCSSSAASTPSVRPHGAARPR